VNPVIVSCSVDSVKSLLAERAALTAREQYGAPFDPSARSFGFAAHSDSQTPPIAVMLMTIAGGVATIDELIVASPSSGSEAASMLVRRFEETASYHNCHKARALVKLDGATAELLTRAGYRVEALLKRHYFQADFIEVVRWLQ
jgi:hypothetical protein